MSLGFLGNGGRGASLDLCMQQFVSFFILFKTNILIYINVVFIVPRRHQLTIKGICLMSAAVIFTQFKPQSKNIIVINECFHKYLFIQRLHCVIESWLDSINIEKMDLKNRVETHFIFKDVTFLKGPKESLTHGSFSVLTMEYSKSSVIFLLLLLCKSVELWEPQLSPYG